ncbi:pyrroloquinoline quinone biosynthesis protein PqqB [Xanthobacteraceae bacterium A53D]
MRIIVLGAAAGGGVPQWNCRCEVCRIARSGDGRVKPRTQCGLAVSADGEDWVLVNAAPDLRQQMLATPALWPQEGLRSSPVNAVIVTNAEVDHVAGLLTLRERQSFALHATPDTRALLDANPIFQALDPALVSPHALEEERTVGIGGLAITPFPVPGKVPLYMEGEAGASEAIVGLKIEHGGRTAILIPNCARITDELISVISGADLLLFDGTAFTDDEMLRQGLSHKTAARMGHVAMDGPDGSLARLAGVAVGVKAYIHINNSNPVLIAGSPQRARVEAAGWQVAEDGMEFVL